MNKYEFYSTILQEDFPVKYREAIADNDSEQRKEIRELREALARVEAERDGWKEQRDILADYCRRADERARTAQAQRSPGITADPTRPSSRKPVAMRKINHAN